MDKKQIEIFFDTGETDPIEWKATNEINNFRLKISKILIIKMQDKKPIEGWDTSLLLLKDGKPIEIDRDTRVSSVQQSLFSKVAFAVVRGNHLSFTSARVSANISACADM